MSVALPAALVVSDDSAFGGALAATLSDGFDARLVPLADAQRCASTKTPPPALIIVDLADSLDVANVSSVAMAVATLVLGTDDPQLMIEAVEAGALGFMSRESSLNTIGEAALTVSRGTAIIPPLMLGALLQHVVQRRRLQSAALGHLNSLTPRQNEVFELAALGLDYESIAERLFISPATARTHAHQIFKKLEIHSRAELVALAAAAGLPTSEGS